MSLEAQDQRRKERLEWRREEVWKLAEEGYQITECSYDHFRINKLLDLFLLHNRYFDLKRREGGDYTSVKEFVRDYFALRPILRFQATDIQPPPDIPNLWFLKPFASWRKFATDYKQFKLSFEEVNKGRINPNTAIGQALIKAIEKK